MATRKRPRTRAETSSSTPTSGPASATSASPGCALVGSYANVVARIREYNELGIDLFFLAGYPHLEEAYRLGEHVLPHFRGERDGLVKSTDAPIELRAVNGGPTGA